MTKTWLPPPIHISPPLLNSANPWATTQEDLQALFDCPSTGAVTTRTALLRGFAHDPARHRYAFFDAGTHAVGAVTSVAGESAAGVSVGVGVGVGVDANASLNNMGYSPVPLDGYLGFIEAIVAGDREKETGKGMGKGKGKLFIVSVTGTPDDVAECYRRVAMLGLRTGAPLAVEVNLSCPNIPGAPPAAYAAEGLRPYLDAVARAAAAAAAAQVEVEVEVEGGGGVPWGVKVPPYTHAGQFDMLAGALRGGGGEALGSGGNCPASFVTATNTLGSCLLLGGGGDGPALGGETGGIGGMAGAPLHPLALGNVATLRRMLDAVPETSHVQIIGVGGVEDAAGYRRMRDVGAAAVGVGTALGRKGVGVFGEIEDGLRVLSGDGEGAVW
ncbi:dihydroorotate dehydrogenase [Daldinia decipiens]|uniref:dihydroorotate dehydrogenase n=1 Tax=Daldinia decipiens TaxID=326647 RepID=UPI0020C4F77A|nr:dihydroorotate dehydrogenase [Daldinia decipiens]KAI1662716.1 dihydroorotate dehydrogenase [Daldinia decipiens]